MEQSACNNQDVLASSHSNQLNYKIALIKKQRRLHSDIDKTYDEVNTEPSIPNKAEGTYQCQYDWYSGEKSDPFL